MLGLLKGIHKDIGEKFITFLTGKLILPNQLRAVHSPPRPPYVLMAFTELIPLSHKGPTVVVRSTPVKLQRFRVPSVWPTQWSAHCSHLAAFSPRQKLRNHNDLLLFRVIFPWLWKNLRNLTEETENSEKNWIKRHWSACTIIKMCSCKSFPLCKLVIRSCDLERSMTLLFVS